MWASSMPIDGMPDPDLDPDLVMDPDPDRVMDPDPDPEINEKVAYRRKTKSFHIHSIAIHRHMFW